MALTVPPVLFYTIRPRTAVEAAGPWYDLYRPAIMLQEFKLYAVEMRIERGTVRFGEPSTRKIAEVHLNFIHTKARVENYLSDQQLQERIRDWWRLGMDYVFVPSLP